MEISPNIHWIETNRSNIYLIIDLPNIVLVDTGMPKKEGLIFERLQSLGHAPTDLSHILITHADIDHAGSLAALQAASGAQVLAGAETANLLAHGKSPQHLPIVMQWIVNTFMRYGIVDEAAISIFKDGDTLPLLGGLQVLASPGHTSDHFSFFSSALGVLFAGDALDTRNGRINLTPPPITADKTAARHSGIHLLQLSPAVIACGHGTPSTKHTSDDLMALFNVLRQE